MMVDKLVVAEMARDAKAALIGCRKCQGERTDWDELADAAAQACAAIAQKRVNELEAALFGTDESDASYNLQGALHDLEHQFNPNDGGVIARTISRVIDQLERARTALPTMLKGNGDGPSK